MAQSLSLNSLGFLVQPKQNPPAQEDAKAASGTRAVVPSLSLQWAQTAGIDPEEQDANSDGDDDEPTPVKRGTARLHAVYKAFLPDLHPCLWLLLPFVIGAVLYCVDWANSGAPPMQKVLVISPDPTAIIGGGGDVSDPSQVQSRTLLWKDLMAEGYLLMLLWGIANVGFFLTFMLVRAMVIIVLVNVLSTEKQMVFSVITTLDPEFVYVMWSLFSFVVWNSTFRESVYHVEDGISHGIKDTLHFCALLPKRILMTEDMFNLSSILWNTNILLSFRRLLFRIMVFRFELGFMTNSNSQLVKYLTSYSQLWRLNIRWVTYKVNQEKERAAFLRRKNRVGHHTPFKGTTRSARYLKREASDAMKQLEALLQAPIKGASLPQLGVDPGRDAALQFRGSHKNEAPSRNGMPRQLQKRTIEKSRRSKIQNWMLIHYVMHSPPTFFVAGRRIELQSKAVAVLVAETLFSQFMMHSSTNDPAVSDINERDSNSSSTMPVGMWPASAATTPHDSDASLPLIPHIAGPETLSKPPTVITSSGRPHGGFLERVCVKHGVDANAARDAEPLVTPSEEHRRPENETSAHAAPVFGDAPHHSCPPYFDAEIDDAEVRVQPHHNSRESGQPEDENNTMAYQQEAAGSRASDALGAAQSHSSPTSNDAGPAHLTGDTCIQRAVPKLKNSPVVGAPNYNSSVLGGLSKDSVWWGGDSGSELTAGNQRRTLSSCSRTRTSDKFFDKEFLCIFLKSDEADDVMHLIDLGGHGKIDKSMFVRAFVTVYRLRSSIIKLLKSQASISKTVGRMISLLLLVITLVMLLLILGINLDTVLVTGAAVLSALIVILGYFYQQFITAVLFVAFTNPYNVGDRVRIQDGVAMYVQRIRTYSTDFEDLYGKIVNCSNSVLWGQKIVNESRSRNATLDFLFRLHTRTEMRHLRSLELELTETVASRPMDFVKDSLAIFVTDVQPGRWMEVNVFISTVEGWTNWRKVFRLRTELNLVMHKLFMRHQIWYYEPKRLVQLTNAPQETHFELRRRNESPVEPRM